MKPLRILSWFRKPFHILVASIPWICLGPELLSSIYDNRKEQPEPAKQIARYRRSATIRILATHLLPIVASATLLYINVWNIYFEPPGVDNQNTRLNALQFAAKIHEVLINVSLSAMVLHYIQYELLHGRGIPLGSIFASFQITNLGNLWSPSLWAATSAGVSKAHRAFFVGIIFIALLVGGTSGPASAILMVPSLGYWTRPSTANPYELFVGANASILWPMIVNTETFPIECNSTGNQIPEYCPIGGFSNLLAMGNPDWASSRSWDFSMPTTNMDGRLCNHHIEGGQLSIDPSWPNTLHKIEGWKELNVAMTISAFTGDILSTLPGSWDSVSLWPDVGRNSLAKSEGNLLGPLVYTACNTTPYNWTNGSLWSSSYGYNEPESDISKITFPMMSSQTWSIDFSKLLAVWENIPESATLWIEPPDMGNFTPSIGILSAYPLHIGHAPNISSNPLLFSPIAITACSVFAAWKPVDIYLNTSGNIDVYSPIIDRSASTLLDPIQDTPLAPQQCIKIDATWANSALPPNDTIGELARKLDEYPLSDLLNVSNPPKNILPGALAGITAAILLVDVLSRIGITEPKLMYSPPAGRDQSRQLTYFLDGDQWDWDSTWGNLTDTLLYPSGRDPDHNSTVSTYTQDNLTEFRLTFIKYGYLYSMDGLTRRVAAGILLVHALVAVLYMAVVVWFGWNCYGLQSLIEILVLAINSQPSEKLNNTCAGVSRLDTYKHIIKVREVSDRRVGFVFDDGESWNAPVPGKLYGELIEKEVLAGEKKSSIIEEIKEVHSLDEEGFV